MIIRLKIWNAKKSVPHQISSTTLIVFVLNCELEWAKNELNGSDAQNSVWNIKYCLSCVIYKWDLPEKRVHNSNLSNSSWRFILLLLRHFVKIQQNK